MQFDILTLFPGMFSGPLTESIIKRAVQAGRISISVHDIRSYATDKHHTADDAPYGLWMTFDRPLAEDPIFVTTDPTVPAKDNLFVPAEQYPVAAAGPQLLARLRGVVEFPEDFNVTVIAVSTAGIDGVARHLGASDLAQDGRHFRSHADDSLEVLWRAGAISFDEALRRTSDRPRLEKLKDAKAKEDAPL